MKITSLISGKSLTEEIAELRLEQMKLLKRCRELESASLGTLSVIRVPSGPRWKDAEGNSVSSAARECYVHRFKDPLTGRTASRRLGPSDKALTERIKLSLLCKKMIPVIEYNIKKLEALERTLRDPYLYELEQELPAVYYNIGFASEAFMQEKPESGRKE